MPAVITMCVKAASVLILCLALLAAPAQAADITVADAKYALAVKLDLGDGVARSADQALALYCEAARLGNADAAYAAAWMFLNGNGTRRASDNGLAWLQLASRLGKTEASRWLALAQPQGAARQPHCRTAPEAARGSSPYVSLAMKAAAEAKVDPHLVVAVMAIESGFQANAVSPKNAKGLMQLTDDTARRFGVADIFDPAQNLRGGARYLRWLIDYFDGDLTRVLAGYNAGEQAVVRYNGIPPYAETRAYVQKIRSRLSGDAPMFAAARFDLPAKEPPQELAPSPPPDPIGAIGRSLGGLRLF